MDKNEELLEWQSKIEEKSPIATNKRVLLKAKGSIPVHAIRCRIVAAEGRRYLVKSLNQKEIQHYECVKAGTLISPYENSSLLSVGDFVQIIAEKTSSTHKIAYGTIIAVEERNSFLSRRDIRTPSERIIAANVDHLIIMASIKQPKYNRRLIDRLLIAAELGNLTPVICINKIDMGSIRDIEKDLKVYRDLEIDIFFTSLTENLGINTFREFLSERSSVLIGSSGVGKSTLINSLFGMDMQKIGDVSKKTTKGRHTTSFVRLFGFEEGGEIIDTPGIREFGLFGIEPEELTLYFHDFDEYYENCRFMPCTHTHEPNCAVKEAVETGQICTKRYESYLNIFESLQEE